MDTRLKEETEYKPKPMVMIGNRPILWHIIKIYASYGHNDFVLCLGYKGEAIKGYFYHLTAVTGVPDMKETGMKCESGLTVASLN